MTDTQRHTIAPWHVNQTQTNQRNQSQLNLNKAAPTTQQTVSFQSNPPCLDIPSSLPAPALPPTSRLHHVRPYFASSSRTPSSSRSTSSCQSFSSVPSKIAAPAPPQSAAAASSHYYTASAVASEAMGYETMTCRRDLDVTKPSKVAMAVEGASPSSTSYCTNSKVAAPATGYTYQATPAAVPCYYGYPAAQTNAFYYHHQSNAYQVYGEQSRMAQPASPQIRFVYCRT